MPFIISVILGQGVRPWNACLLGQQTDRSNLPVANVTTGPGFTAYRSSLTALQSQAPSLPCPDPHSEASCAVLPLATMLAVTCPCPPSSAYSSCFLRLLALCQFTHRGRSTEPTNLQDESSGKQASEELRVLLPRWQVSRATVTPVSSTPPRAPHRH
jgi:hypothetical protein